MNREFEDKVAVVTGAAQGIGLAIAEHLHEQGAAVVLVDRKADALHSAAEVFGARKGAAVHSIVTDLEKPGEIEALAEELGQLESKVDILVNNAGIEADTAFEDVSVDLFNQVMAVNLRAPLHLAQRLVRMFPGSGGSIVNISSIHADHAFANSIPYACSKAGLVALTRNLALELAPRRIRVNAVCPGYIDTPMWNEWLRTAHDPEALARHTEELHPLGRRGVPQDVAMAVAYLAGRQSAWVTGTCLVVDGGLTVRTHP